MVVETWMRADTSNSNNEISQSVPAFDCGVSRRNRADGSTLEMFLNVEDDTHLALASLIKTNCKVEYTNIPRPIEVGSVTRNKLSWSNMGLNQRRRLPRSSALKRKHSTNLIQSLSANLC